MVGKRAVTLADGRALLYFGDLPERPSDYPDRAWGVPDPSGWPP
jgi:hypothetical protein